LQLSLLFEIKGFKEFTLVICNNLLRDNHFGMLFRVACGATLSVLDAATDFYAITTYVGRASEAVRTNMRSEATSPIVTLRCIVLCFGPLSVLLSYL